MIITSADFAEKKLKIEMVRNRIYNKFSGNSDEILQALRENQDWNVISITNNGSINSFVLFYYIERRTENEGLL
jgi:hypothetical protein